ncbi:MAG TPA: hypothetical protein VIM75_13475 [Ohtaekwangia sp.]|uniref:hypothetical protein n=1 Tax=Ohtaekwangia sp. TaxID=2066019 RepID=UPI002F94B968
MQRFYLFAILIVLAIGLSFAMDRLVLTDDVYYYSLIDSLSAERIDEILKSMKSLAWLGYVMVPFITALKIFLVAACIYTGAFFTNKNISFSAIFKSALHGEFIFLLPTMMRLLWFTFTQQDYTLDDVSAFPPLSIVPFFDLNKEEDMWILYPLSFINLFQVTYVAVVAQTLTVESGIPFTSTVGLVARSYGLGLLLWILFVTFLIISIS